jgi:GxxExxY protein
MAIKLQDAGRCFESEPYVPVTLANGTAVKGQIPDLVVERSVIVELKAHIYTLSRDEQAQVIGYFAALPECSVALYLNFGRSRLEVRRLFPPKTVQAYQRAKWGSPEK